MDMAAINSVVNEIDSLVWGPIMLTLLVGTDEQGSNEEGASK